MKRFLILLVILFFAQHSYSQEIRTNLQTNFDSDKNLLLNHTVGYYQLLGSNLTLGVFGGYYGVHNNDIVNYYPKAGLYTSYSFLEYDTFELNLFYIFQNKTGYDALYRINPKKWISMDLLSSYTMLDVNIIDNQNNFIMSNGVTVDIIPKSWVTTTVGYIYQTIEQEIQDIDRNIYIASLNFTFNDTWGFLFNSRIRRMADGSPMFFTPNRFDTHTIGAYYGVVLFNENISLIPSFSVGRQYIKRQSGFRTDSNIYEIGIRARGWVTANMGFSLNVNYSNALHSFGSYNNNNILGSLLYKF